MLLRFRMPENVSDTNSKKENSAHIKEIYNKVETPEELSWAGSVPSTLTQIHQNNSLEPGKAGGTSMLRGLCRTTSQGCPVPGYAICMKGKGFPVLDRNHWSFLSQKCFSCSLCLAVMCGVRGSSNSSGRGAACGTQHRVVIAFPALKNMFLFLKKRWRLIAAVRSSRYFA